jgi:hypothetical protein
MANQIKTFDLNEHQHEAFDYNHVHDLYGGLLTKNSWPLVGSLLTPNGHLVLKTL